MIKKSLDMLKDCMIVISIISMVYNFTFKIININGNSMFPTLFNKQKFILKNSINNDYKINDIIVYKRNIYTKKFMIKRIIAIYGDKILITKKGELFVNESFVYKNKKLLPIFRIIPKNCVFVIGDNYNNSIDSRCKQIGIIHMKFIFGKISTI